MPEKQHSIGEDLVLEMKDSQQATAGEEAKNDLSSVSWPQPPSTQYRVAAFSKSTFFPKSQALRTQFFIEAFKISKKMVEKKEKKKF